MNTLALKRWGFKTKLDQTRFLQFLIVASMLIVLIMNAFTIVSAEEGHITITGFDAFDNMYQYHMGQEDSLVNDIMTPVNDVVFFLMKLEMQFLGTLIVLLCVSSAIFAVWYALSPDFADEVSEVKMRVAGGEQIPIDDFKAFALQFVPDIKANSGIADSYEYERPSLGLLARDHLLKFVLIFAIAIAIQQSTLITFIVKAGNALAFGADYYTENTDFRGMVETWTTAGSDYPISFDTLTTKGQNQKKLYNAIYTALKKEKPRDRTEEFLGRIGAATQKFVEVTAVESGVIYDYENFIVNVFTTGIMNEQADVSDIEVRTIHKLEDFGFTESDNVTSTDILKDKYIYISVMQYDTVAETSTSVYSSVSTYTGAWEMSGAYPIKLNVHAAYAASVNTGYTFQGDKPSVAVKAYLSNSSEPVLLTATVNKSSNTYTIDFSSNIKSKVTAGVSVKKIEITGLASNNTMLIKDSTTKSIAGTATWKAD